MNTGFSLSRKETFSVSMVIFIGMFYLLSLASALYKLQTVHAAIVFGAREASYLFLGLFYLVGVIAFFRLRNAGWVICTATLFNFIVVVLRFVVAVIQSRRFDGFALITVSSFLLVLIAFVFLFDKESRTRFHVNNKSYLLVLIVYGLLLAITFLI